jgi:hypothetical protein
MLLFTVIRYITVQNALLAKLLLILHLFWLHFLEEDREKRREKREKLPQAVK